jgi:hypothetical protein
MNCFRWIALGLLVAAANAYAQAWPARPVTFIVPFAPGGGTDITARTVAAKLTQMWGQAGSSGTVVVDNRTGAGGLIGADAVAKAKPDGYTLLIANVGTQSINPYLYPKMPYDPDKAFAPVSLICELPFVMMASNAFPPASVKEVIAYAKANPGKVTYGSSGIGGSPHLTAELFQGSPGPDDARALQGRRAGDDRPHLRADQHHVRLGAGELQQHQGGQGEGPGRDARQAQRRAARRADDRGSRRAGRASRARGSRCSRPRARHRRSSTG